MFYQETITREGSEPEGQASERKVSPPSPAKQERIEKAVQALLEPAIRKLKQSGGLDIATAGSLPNSPAELQQLSSQLVVFFQAVLQIVRTRPELATTNQMLYDRQRALYEAGAIPDHLRPYRQRPTRSAILLPDDIKAAILELATSLKPIIEQLDQGLFSSQNSQRVGFWSGGIAKLAADQNSFAISSTCFGRLLETDGLYEQLLDLFYQTFKEEVAAEQPINKRSINLLFWLIASQLFSQQLDGKEVVVYLPSQRVLTSAIWWIIELNAVRSQAIRSVTIYTLTQPEAPELVTELASVKSLPADKLQGRLSAEAQAYILDQSNWQARSIDEMLVQSSVDTQGLTVSRLKYYANLWRQRAQTQPKPKPEEMKPANTIPPKEAGPRR